MTRKEAIKWLETFKDYTGVAELSQAFDVAIKALEQEPCEDAISREAVLKLFATHDGNYLYEAIDEAIKHYEEEEEEKEKDARFYSVSRPDKERKEYSIKRANECRQLAEWLKELKAARRVLEGYGIYYHDGRHYYEEGIQ